jgi:hypothetical protein
VIIQFNNLTLNEYSLIFNINKRYRDFIEITMLASISIIYKNLNPIEKQIEYVDNYKYVQSIKGIYELLDIVKILFFYFFSHKFLIILISNLKYYRSGAHGCLL